jgi:prophage DNA circulation protein
LEQASKELPTVREYNLPQTTTAFNISASLYNTYARTDDIINRNNISNPFFVESGSTLEVVV